MLKCFFLSFCVWYIYHCFSWHLICTGFIFWYFHWSDSFHLSNQSWPLICTDFNVWIPLLKLYCIGPIHSIRSIILDLLIFWYLFKTIFHWSSYSFHLSNQSWLIAQGSTPLGWINLTLFTAENLLFHEEILWINKFSLNLI